MSHFLNKLEKQHSTEEANKSGLVTKMRLLVESINKYIKQWSALNIALPYSQFRLHAIMWELCAPYQMMW